MQMKRWWVMVMVLIPALLGPASAWADPMALRADVQRLCEQAQMSPADQQALMAEVRWIRSNAERPAADVVARLRSDVQSLDPKDPRLIDDVRDALVSAGVPPDHVRTVCSAMRQVVSSPHVTSDDLRRVLEDARRMRRGGQ